MFVVAEAERLGLSATVVTSPYELAQATEVACSLLDVAEPPTAAFCFSDSIAYGVYAACADLGLAIPDQVSVIGYDDHPVSALLMPALTSFDWESERLAGIAVGMVLAAIEGAPSGGRVVIRPTLRSRGSTAAPPAG
jgi:LacI family transcriptional regulator